MPKLISKPTRFPDDTMTISEFFGRISSGDTGVSIARLTSAAGWSEPPQRPEFDEFTLVLRGALYLTSEDGSVTIVREDQAVFVPAGEQVQYSSPEGSGADYVAVCLPAFAPELTHRERR
ncbi:MAG: cupin domain-containing protein [Thermoguttaceae bacterium]|nr:cupin domain-containing protein [Planctomycetaceae bacterium]MBQ4144822.1 cupin domain-containing protein [Thermoguttaceae bacterium]